MQALFAALQQSRSGSLEPGCRGRRTMAACRFSTPPSSCCPCRRATAFRWPSTSCCATGWRPSCRTSSCMQAAAGHATANWRWSTRPAYIQAITDGSVDAAVMREIGFPWSQAMAERARRSVGATIAACRAAFARGRGGQHRRRHPPRLRRQGRRLLRLQRRRRGRPPDAGRVRAAASAQPLRVAIDRPRRAPGQRHGRASSATTPACSRCRCTAQKNFPFRKEAERPRRRPARRLRRRRLPAGAGARRWRNSSSASSPAW